MQQDSRGEAEHCADGWNEDVERMKDNKCLIPESEQVRAKERRKYTAQLTHDSISPAALDFS